MKTVTALDLRKKLGSVLSSVEDKHEPATITRANKPLAVIISALHPPNLPLQLRESKNYDIMPICTIGR